MSIWAVLALTLGIGLLTAGAAPAFVWLAALPTLLAPAVSFIREERRSRGRWHRELPRLESATGGAYRQHALSIGYRTRAPLEVRLAAASCFTLGVAFVPGLALGLMGLFVAAVGIVSVPGLWVAHELWASGKALLDGSPERMGRVLAVARVSKTLNVLLLVLGGTAFVYSAFQGDQFTGVVVGIVAIEAYALVSLGQAIWLESVARRVLSDAAESG